jgi:predicted deacylase
MEILGQRIDPGRSYSLDLQVARTYDTTKVSIPVMVHRGTEGGSTVLIVAGMHGDEVTGMESARRLLRRLKSRPVVQGTLVIIPILNVFGFLTMSRSMPDGRDMNRYFPGSATGSLTSRLTHALVHEVLPAVDIIIDLHSGSAQRVNFPQVRYTGGDEQSFELAHIFNPPFYLNTKPIKGSLRSYCNRKDLPYLLLEGGTSSLIDDQTLATADQGIANILAHFGLWNEPVEKNGAGIHLHRSRWVRSAHSGLLKTLIPNGSWQKKGTPLAYVNDPYGRSEKQIKSPHDGFVIAVNNSPAVIQGDPLFHIGIID